MTGLDDLRGGMTIREANAGDLEQLVALYRHLNPEDPVLPVDAGLRGRWRDMLAHPGLHITVAEVESTVRASCVLCVVPNLTRGARPFAVIENVVTESAFRRRGLGTGVLKFALAKAWELGCYKVMLMTGSKRTRTLEFYEKAGFVRGTKTAFVAKPMS